LTTRSWPRFVPRKLLNFWKGAIWKGAAARVNGAPSRTWHEITAEASQTADPNRVGELAHELLRLYDAERKHTAAEETLLEEDAT